MAIDYNKFLKTGTTPKASTIDYSKFLKTTTPLSAPTPKPQGEILTKTLSPDLGGGTYKMEVGNPNALIKTPRSDYGGLPTKEGYERADIFPVSLGGVNASSTNINYEKFLPKDQQKPGQLTKTDKYLDEVILPQYKSGKMSLREAQVLATSYLRNEQTGLNKAMENQNLGGKVGELADKIVGFFKGQKQEKKQPMVFKVGEGLNEEDKKIAEQIINYEVEKGKEEKFIQPTEQIKQSINSLNQDRLAYKAVNKTLTPDQQYQKSNPYIMEQAKAASKAIGKEIKPENYLEEYKNFTKEEKDLTQAISKENKAEVSAQIATAPIRFLAGYPAAAITSYALEKADSNLKYTPKTDAEKLIIGDYEIQRLMKSDDLYGVIGRGAGLPTAALAIAIIENPFIAGTGIGGLIKNTFKKQIEKQGEKYLAKIGTKEIIRIADESIKTERLAGKITEQEAIKASESIKGLRVKTVKPTEPQIKPQEPAGDVLDPKTTKPLVPSEIAKIETPTVKKPVVESIRKKIAYNIEPDTKTKLLLKENKVGVEELPFDNKGNITLYREGPATPGKLTSYSLGKKWEGQTPSIVNKNDIIINTNSPELSKLYNNTYKAPEELSANLSALDKFKNLEGEIMVIQPKVEVPPIKQTIEYIPEEKPIDLRKKITTKPLIAKSSVPTRIQDSAISKGLKDTFGETFEHDIITFEDQAKKVGQILDEDPEKAIRIALGQEAPTNGALPESVLMAVVKQAEKKGDIELLRRLATEEKGVAQEASLLGARIKMYDQQLEDNAFKNIRDVAESRKKSFKGNLKETKNKEIAKIKEEIKKVKPKKDEWLEFISSITC